MQPVLVALLALASASPAIASADSASPDGWDRERFFREVRLFEISEPTSAKPEQIFMTKMLEEQLQRPLREEERRVLGRTDSGKWRVYEDDQVRFELPDDPLLKVSLSTPATPKSASVVGGAVRSGSISSFKRYVVTVGENVPYVLLFLGETTDLDNSVCFCGPIVFEKITLREGNLRRFDFLSSGDIKRAQAIGATERLVLHEWTHTAIPQAAYARIAASLTLKKKSPLSREEWQRKTGKDFAWIDRGATIAELRAFFGSTGKLENNVLTFEEIENPDTVYHSKTIWTFPLKNGALVEDGSIKKTSLDLQLPQQGTAAWGRGLQASSEEGSPWENTHDGTATIPATPENLAYFWEQFLNESITNDPEFWDTWCVTASSLHGRDIVNPAILPVVKKHFLNPRLPPEKAAALLETYGHGDLLPEMILARLQMEFSFWEKNPQADPVALGFSSALLQYLDEPRQRKWIRQGLLHPSAYIRFQAIFMCDQLPNEEGAATVRQLLAEEKAPPAIRSAALNLLAEKAGSWLTAADRTWVKTLVAAEEHTYARDTLLRWLEESTEE